MTEPTGADQAALVVEQQWGHPGRKWAILRAQVADEGVQEFASVQDRWLDLLWTLDQFRIARVPPIGMGKAGQSPAKRLEGVYRGKGHWFADLLALLLGNRTNQILAPRSKVRGFSQNHQIDIAWPAAHLPGEALEDPRVCVETKLTGAPAYGDTRARGAMSDWSNRRKELKFAATDLKLARREVDTQIDHWGVWRESAPPLTFFLWAARLRPDDSVERMAKEARALVDTYLEGAGIFAYQERAELAGYEPVPVPFESRVTSMDDVLHRVASHIKHIVQVEGPSPQVQRPDKRTVDTEQIQSDSEG